MATPRRSVLLAGYYGCGNTGDEAILAAILQDLRALRPTLEFVVASADPGQTAERHGVSSLLWTDVPAILEAARRCDLIVLGGGGVFQDYWGARPETLLTRHHGGASFYAGFPLLATLSDRPCMIYAAGVGPLLSEQGKGLTRLAFEHAAKATVRDSESRELLLGLGLDGAAIRVTADPAFRLQPDREAGRSLLGAQAEGEGPLVGVCLRNWEEGVAPDVWQAQVAEALDAFVEERKARLVFVPFQVQAKYDLTNDRTAAEAVASRMRHAPALLLSATPGRPEAVAGLLAECDLVLGMRLHSLIFAASAGTAAVALAYDRKVRSLMGGLGLGDQVLDLAALTASRLLQAMGEAWDRREEARGLLAPTVAKLKDQAGMNARLALEVLDAPPQGAPEPRRMASLRRFGLERTLLLDAKDREAETLAEEMAALRNALGAERAARERVSGQLAAIMASRSWLFARRLQGIRRTLAPPGSFRERLLRALRKQASAAARAIDRFIDTPRGPFAERYLEESNRTVVLYTDDPGLFPGYEPRRPLPGPAGVRVRVSVVATARNEGENARLWLQDIARQSRPPDEVIVVDGGSTDGTMELLSSWVAQSPFPLVVIGQPGANIARGRNLAIERASGTVMASTDLGCRLPPEWLERLVAPFEDDAETQVVAGWYEAMVAGRPRRRRWWPTLATIRPEACVPSSRSVAFTKDAWGAVGGYPEWLTLTGEDTYFALELQRSCPSWAFVPQAAVEWDAPASLAGYWRKLHAWTQGDGESGVRSRYYWRDLLHLVGLSVSATAGAAAVIGLLGGLHPAPAAALILVALLASRWWRPGALRSPVAELVADGVAVAGFIRGARRADEVEQRKARSLRGIVFILAGVPMDDTGGGSRAAQLAQELLHQRFGVVFVHRFARNETVELGLRLRHPNLVSFRAEDFNWDRLDAAWTPPPRDLPLFAVVEFPLGDFLPILAGLRARGAVAAYDLLDDWDTSLGGDWYTPATEERVVAECRVLLATAPDLAARLERVSGRPVELLPNAVNLRLFDRRRPYRRPADLPEAEWSLIYAGALWGSWFDWDLLVQVAVAHPEAAVVVIGDYRGECPQAPGNIHFLGLKPQRQLPAYLAHSSVAIVPWKLDAITRATSPLKVYEYLAMGRPVVAPDLPTLADVPFLLRSPDRAAFLRNLERARALHIDHARLEAFLRENAWPERVRRLLGLLRLSSHDAG